IRTCTMHQKIHDFIATDVSSFMDSCQPLDLAHRFSINSGVTLEGPSCSSDILSLLDSLPGSDQWQLLKVLDLEGCTDLKNKNLKNICKILLLKYLSLRNTGVTQLPKKIEKLQCLETLDIRQTKIRAFATKSIFLPMLKHLLASNKGSPSRSDNNSHGFEESPATMELPSGTRRMERLEILSHVDAFNNVNDLIDIGQLLQLRKLGVVLDGKKAGSLALLFKQIEELHGCLLTLSIQINHPATSEGTVPETDKLAALVSPPKLLQSLNISGITSGLPGWITKLDQLTKITLSNTYLGEDAIRVLGKLRILRCLRLRHKSYTGTKLTFNTEEFQHLKSLVVDGCDITNIDFVNIGAAPKLEMIIWTFDSVDALPLSGIEHLPKLKKLELNGDEDMAEMRLIREAHPNCPVFKHNSSHQHEEAGSD
uniref:Disease resistance R13L4/SHOC-2-like LRR domain-containing protein n=1 Tax=Oryza glaberrima TaxID=4538 RepID=I1R1V5_ORYGL